MPGPRYDAQTKERFHRLMLEEKMSAEEAGKRVGVSPATAYRWSGGRKSHDYGSSHPNRRAPRDVPDPKPYTKLSDTAKRMIAPDGFPLFAEKVFAWRTVPWQQKAAKVSVEAILDRSERHYGIANEPPGSGKSSLWTFVIPAWLVCGGGMEDPGWGRALRFMFGHAAKTTSTHYVQRFARLLSSPRPYYDKNQRVYGEVTLAKEFGRFKPLGAMGDIELWQDRQFTVAQLEDVDLADKEPTCQAASYRTEFVGERCEYASWDDLVTEKNSKTIELVEAMGDWFEKEAEPRIEPGGILWLVGQRISSIDLFRHRLNDMWIDEDGTPRQKYFHIVFPIHHEATCDGNHRQWNAEPEGDGCLLDEVRLPWRDVLKVANRPHFRTVFQQEDSDPTSSLVTEAILEGGTVPEADPLTGVVQQIEYPGCYDRDRGFGDFPPRADNLVNYATVDPSVSKNWVIEWWACAGKDLPRYLIWGMRRQMQAGDLLDWDERKQEHTGWMESLQRASVAAGHPIRVWVIESVSAFNHLFQYRHFHTWKQKWPYVTVIPHQTQKNKMDSVLGVEALLRGVYRQGMKRLPRKHGDLVALRYLRDKTKELTTWPRGAYDDTVMADWFGESNIETILRLGRKPLADFEVDVKLPPYLMRQRREVEIRR